MPEGDTVHLAAARLHGALAGSTLTATDFRVPRYATTDLSGYGVEAVRARGKHLLMRIGATITVHSHLKMDGTWHLYPPGSWRRPGRAARVILTTDRWIAVGFDLSDVQIVPRVSERDLVGHLGPDVLGGDWDPAEVVHRMRCDPARPVGDVLLDQRVLAGVGNVYRCELCFLRGVHPTTAIAQAGDLDALVRLTKRVMEANRKSALHVTTGDARPGRRHWVYGRDNRPCLRCGTSIRKLRHGTAESARVTYWCPSCQPFPGADRFAGRGPRVSGDESGLP